MREIIFRGKQKDNGVFIEGDLIQISEGRKFIIDNKFGACIDDKGNFINTEAPFVCEVLPETVGQYTGLTDKNGTKIFEGDIVKFIHKNKLKPYDDLISPFYESYSRNYKIEYTNTFARYGLRFINGSIHFPCKQSTLLMYDCEVIGNIHDNPELLGEPMKSASKNVAQSGLAPATENFELLEG